MFFNDLSPTKLQKTDQKRQFLTTQRLATAHHFNSPWSLRGVVTAAMIHQRLQEKIEGTWHEIRGIWGFTKWYIVGSTKGLPLL